jgi:hypothetical protein
MRTESKNEAGVNAEIREAADKLRATYPAYVWSFDDNAARESEGMSINEWIAYRNGEYDRAIRAVLDEHAPGFASLDDFFSDDEAANILRALQELLTARTGAAEIGKDGPEAEPPGDEKGDDSGAEPQTDEAPVTGGKFEDVCNQWVWVVGLKRFIRVKDSKMWDREQFDSRFNHFVSTASVSANIFKTAGAIRRFDGAVFRPGQKMVLPPDFNLWRMSKIVPKEGDTTLWDAHLDYLFKNPDDKGHVLNWLSWVYQNQTRKPNHALLIIGENTGTGKSFIARVFEQLIGTANTQRPKNSSLKGDFNGWALRCKLCIIEELMQIGRKEVAGELRDVITEPTIECNIKNVPAQLVENYMAMMGISNHTDALPIDDTDRRWLVVETQVKKEQNAEQIKAGYFDKLFTILEGPKSAELLAAIAYQLKTRKLEGYSGLGVAPITYAKREMVRQSMTSLETWLSDNIENSPLSRNLVNINSDIVLALPRHVLNDAAIMRGSDKAIAKFLRTKLAGENIGNHWVPDRPNAKPSRIKLWALRGTAGMYRERGEAATAAAYQAERNNKPTPVNDNVRAEFEDDGKEDVS